MIPSWRRCAGSPITCGRRAACRAKAEAEAFKAAGYSDQHVLEIILALAVKTISNYANHVNHTEVDDAFAPYAVDKTVKAA